MYGNIIELFTSPQKKKKIPSFPLALFPHLFLPQTPVRPFQPSSWFSARRWRMRPFQIISLSPTGDLLVTLLSRWLRGWLQTTDLTRTLIPLRIFSSTRPDNELFYFNIGSCCLVVLQHPHKICGHWDEFQSRWKRLPGMGHGTEDRKEAMLSQACVKASSF